MKKYLNEKSLYVINDDRLIYKVNEYDVYDGYISLNYNRFIVSLSRLAHLNPDENDIQGYVEAINFIEDVQLESVVQYFLEEGLKECLIDNGFEILDKLPKIHSTPSV